MCRFLMKKRLKEEKVLRGEGLEMELDDMWF